MLGSLAKLAIFNFYFVNSYAAAAGYADAWPSGLKIPRVRFSLEVLNGLLIFGRPGFIKA